MPAWFSFLCLSVAHAQCHFRMTAVPSDVVASPAFQFQCVYDDSGSVVDWGPPNIDSYLASVPYYGVVEVEAWLTWQVRVWWQRSGHPWFLSDIFYVMQIQDMRQHWATYFERGQGRTERFPFEVECWLWSVEGGWESYNYM